MVVLAQPVVAQVHLAQLVLGRAVGVTGLIESHFEPQPQHE